MARSVSCPRRTARLLSESEIGQGGLGRACSEEEEGVKGKKEEEVKRRTGYVGRDVAGRGFETLSFCNKTGRVALRETRREKERGIMQPASELNMMTVAEMRHVRELHYVGEPKTEFYMSDLVLNQI
ncbi:hypothetical protein B0H13DRAFT_1876991 [Mycena leptocephala]|nr:hypothetical protein B0H13DRAFT_1876991 [Mycena leptocephala]